MNRPGNALIAAAIAVAGVVVLGACSSGVSDEPQENSSPNAQSSLSESERDAAAAKHNDHVTVPSTKAAKFGNVSLTHSPSAQCSRSERQDENQKYELLIECSNVEFNSFGDAVYVRLPGKAYEVTVENESMHDGLNMSTTQRDYAAVAIARQIDVETVVWKPPNIESASKGWAVGVDAHQRVPIKAKILVTKIK